MITTAGGTSGLEHLFGAKPDGRELRGDWEDLEQDRRGFAWRHLGTATRPMDEVLAALAALDLRPPRTGHLSDWRDIAAGRSSVLDYNKVVCEILDLGRPLLYDFNQTEDAALEAGDTLFLPGSLLRGGVRTVLPLRRWAGAGMRPHDRSTPLFLPYAEAEYEGARIPLTRLHRGLPTGSPAFDADLHSALVLRERRRVEEVLTVLLAAAADDERALSRVFDRVAYRDGRVERVVLRRVEHGYALGPVCYRSAAALVDASFIPAQVAQEAGPLGEVLAQVPEVVPLVSIDVVVLLYAVLKTHRREPTADFDPGRVDVHVQWGALAMAGAPPRRRGYFAGHVSKARAMYEAVVRELDWASPLLFVLAPIAPFLLWPSSNSPGDLGPIERLIARALAVIEPRPDQIDRLGPIFRDIVDAWLAEYRSELTPAFTRQLLWADRRSPTGAELPPGRPVEPAGFGELTAGQACLLVGTLIKALQ